MSDPEHSHNGHRTEPIDEMLPEKATTPAGADGDLSTPNRWEVIRAAAREVMAVEDVTFEGQHTTMRLRGRLTLSPETALARLRPSFESVGHTPRLRRQGSQEEIEALPVVFGRQDRRFPIANMIILFITLLTVFTVGVGQYDALYNPPLGVLTYFITGNTEALYFPNLVPTPEVWQAALGTGVLYTLALMGILGAHEMGHYLVARRHNVNVTLPFFIPFPNILGTLGAVIAMREPAPNRRIQFDIGIAGPLAGLVVAIPIVVIGLMLSEVGTPETILADLPPEVRDATALFSEGNSLLYLGLKYAVFGKILPNSQGEDVWIHPIAFAGWAGLLVTALNLLPVGQLDGGHVIYGLFGEKAARVRQPLLIMLGALGTLGIFQELARATPPEVISQLGETTWQVITTIASVPIPGWTGWWLWVFIIMLLARNHAPVLDEITELDDRRRWLGWLMVAIFFLIFTPAPLIIVPLT